MSLEVLRRKLGQYKSQSNSLPQPNQSIRITDIRNLSSMRKSSNKETVMRANEDPAGRCIYMQMSGWEVRPSPPKSGDECKVLLI
jgi:hypothetical protein